MKNINQGISVFCYDLKEKLCNKIDRFEKFINSIGMNAPRSSKSWISLYKEWNNVGHFTYQNEEIVKHTYLLMRAASRVVEETKIEQHTALSELKEALDNVIKVYKQ